MIRRNFLITLILLIAIALSGCNPTEMRTNATQVPQIVARVPGDPQTFNYALNQSSPNVFGFLYEGLITENGETGKLEPALAESWEISEDNLKIVFTLKPNLKWSDGEPLTVDDIVFTYNNIYFNEQIPTDIRDILRIGKSKALPKVRKLDSRRVEFTVPEPFAPFLRFAGGIVILPEHALRQSVETKNKDGRPQFLSTWGTDTDLQKIVVNGPFTLESYTVNQRIVFRRNPYYWRKDTKGNALPYIERLIWQIVESPDTALIQFRSLGLDMLEIGPTSFQLLKREEDRGNFKIYSGGPDFGTNFICFNLNKGRRQGKPLVNPIKSRWFNTVAFRQAVAYGINREAMLNNVYRGLGELQNSPISVQSPYYLSPEEGLKVYNYNPEKAKELLRGAGFKYNNKGQLLDAEDNRVRFTMISQAGNRTVDAIGSQVKRDLSKIGIQVDFTPIDFAVMVDKITNTLEWESYFGLITGSIEPYSAANVWSPDGGFHPFNQKPQPGQPPIEGREVADWEAEIGRLYIEGARELDETKRKEIYGETQRLAQEYLPFIHLINPLALAAIRDRIEGTKFSALGGTLWNVYELKEAKD
ncbi:ABC transporter substrate-binding protein [Chroococcidiopsis thermalis]|uniref:Extracellular solute-binding protein family 5 n=1 Tax=Chroococcidiopsis thermalis (strain PCC 7203) TaxID=251229 RepID=K9TYD2_CHRTP|nr:ABC transporter substrate-binding protein [Chroococcidiopsis thermalis]AFY87388.1 extracellular solute-binding protein family 5 [Chroococcidiopsis thermalis PCC 7203]